ncbi:purine nucleoside permease [Roseivivax halodurans JCM 10272]|uniref:Purine nucleoside permease n=1 Tax=Roseivivax halodurans JCM 10272 TaxID=1449350 RepID=X7EE63_9RHOB|nr:purine nucleoside permease [Roseivivax halodurans]ETX13486.1 purine nucleoside permease [Roseivivax halodurans JCM 10272]
MRRYAPLVLTLALTWPAFTAAQEPQEVKVFIGSMFEIGELEGDRAGEFQAWYEDYLSEAEPREVPGAANPVWCNDEGVCGSILGMGKVASSSSMMAILLDPALDFSNAYFLMTGVAGTPPDKGTIGAVSWATWLVDYDLGHRWAADEVPEGEPLFMPRDGYEDIRVYELNPDLVDHAVELSSNVELTDSQDAQSYRERYPQETARRAPFVFTGTHMTGDTFFHGPGLSKQAQYMTELYGADDYVITEMEAAAIAQVVDRLHGTDRLLSLRGAVNFDQGHPDETTLEHLDPAPGETAGGFAETIENIHAVGAAFVEEVVNNWDQWREGSPKN